MKKSMIECDFCHKEFEEKTGIFVTFFVNENGKATERCDLCMECWHKTIHQTEKGGGE